MRLKCNFIHCDGLISVLYLHNITWVLDLLASAVSNVLYLRSQLINVDQERIMPLGDFFSGCIRHSAPSSLVLTLLV